MNINVIFVRLENLSILIDLYRTPEIRKAECSFVLTADRFKVTDKTLQNL